MQRIGLTGGIASGKSTVAERFRDHGVGVSSADAFARDVVKPGTPGLEAIVSAFGHSVLHADRSLNRPALRERIFANTEERKQLEQILHPRIRSATADWCDAQAARGARYVLLEIPLLVETDQQRSMDRVIVVDVPEAIQLERIQRRDNCSTEAAQRIVATQASRRERLDAATDVLVNDSDIPSLLADVDALAVRFDTLHG